MRAVIIDDEKGGRIYLNELVDRHLNDVEIVGLATDMESGIACIEKHKPDLVFLDIEMPGGTGFRLLDSLEDLSFQVIFTTAYDNYATKAFRYAAIDYLLKPIDSEELKEATDRARKTMEVSSLRQRIEFAKKNLESMKHDQAVLPISRGYETFSFSEILRIESAGNYSMVFKTDGSRVLVNLNLTQLENRLTPSTFSRVHQSYMVHLGLIKSLQLSVSELLMNDGTVIPVARRRKRALQEAFRAYHAT